MVKRKIRRDQLRGVCPRCLEPKCKCPKKGGQKTGKEKIPKRRKTPTESKTALSSPISNCDLPAGFNIWNNLQKESCIISDCSWVAVIEHVVNIELENVYVLSIRRLCASHALHWMKKTCPGSIEKIPQWMEHLIDTQQKSTTNHT